MTELSIERFHRRVNGPPGSQYPPDHGTLLCTQIMGKLIHPKFYINKYNPAPIGPILLTMGQVTGGRLFSNKVKEDYISCH